MLSFGREHESGAFLYCSFIALALFLPSILAFSGMTILWSGCVVVVCASAQGLSAGGKVGAERNVVDLSDEIRTPECGKFF